MKISITIIATLISILTYGQLRAGFNIDEAKFTVAMCNSYNFIEQYGSNNGIVPSEFNLIHTSDILSLDNKFEVYENGKGNKLPRINS